MRLSKQRTGWGRWLSAAAIAALMTAPAWAYPIRPIYQDGRGRGAGTEATDTSGGAVVDTPESFFHANVDPIRSWNVAGGPRSVSLSKGLVMGRGQNQATTEIVVPGERFYVQSRRRSIVAPLLAGGGTYLGLSNLFESKSSRKRSNASGASSSLVVKAGTGGGSSSFVEPTEWNVTFTPTGQAIDVDGDGQTDVTTNNEGTPPSGSQPTDESFTDLRSGQTTPGDTGNGQTQQASNGDGNELTEQLIASDEQGGSGPELAMTNAANENELTPTEGTDEFTLEGRQANSGGGTTTAAAATSPEPMTAGLAIVALAGLGAWTGRRRARA